jgi:hypothetical protein
MKLRPSLRRRTLREDKGVTNVNSSGKSDKNLSNFCAASQICAGFVCLAAVKQPAKFYSLVYVYYRLHEGSSSPSTARPA